MRIPKIIQNKIITWLMSGVTFWEIKNRLEFVGYEINDLDILKIQKKFIEESKGNS